MLPKMTAQKRADTQWSVVRLMGANTQPGYEQAMIFQFAKQNLPAMKEHWDKQENDPEYKKAIQAKVGGENNV